MRNSRTTFFVVVCALSFSAYCVPMLFAQREGAKQAQPAKLTLNEKERKLLNSIQRAADMKNPKRLEQLLSSSNLAELKILLNYQTETQRTPLVAALMKRRAENIELLLRYGADPNQVMDVMLVIQRNKVKLANVTPLNLLMLNIDVWGVDTRDVVELIKLLTKNGADPNIPDSTRGTPLYYARDMDLSIIKALVDGGADIYLDLRGGSFASYAAKQKKTALGKYVQEVISNPPIQKKAGDIPLPTMTFAVALGQDNWKELERNLAAMENVNEAINAFGHTPLTAAVLSGKPEAVKTVLKFNPLLSMQDSAMTPPLVYAIRGKNREIVTLLTDAGAKLEATRSLREAVLQERMDEIELHVKRLKRDKTEQMTEMLTLAAERNLENSFAMLLKLGAKPSVKRKGTSPLFSILLNANPKLLKVLLREKIPLTVTEEETGLSPLFYVLNESPAKKEELLFLLLDAGVDVNTVQAKTNMTPLMDAARLDEPGCVKVLLDAGAKTRLRNSAGKTAVELTENERIQSLIREAENE